MTKLSTISDLLPDSKNANRGTKRGSQLCAAESVERRCYAMEIEPKFCAVALERLSAMNLKAKVAA